MIYFVDEDHRKLRALISELKFSGYESKVIKDANSAYEELSIVPINDVDIVILDVMLAANLEVNENRYSRERTDDFHKTGLLLLDDLVKANPSVFPKKAIFFTHASSQTLLAHIRSNVEKHNTLYLRKKDFNTALEFSSKVVEIIESMG